LAGKYERRDEDHDEACKQTKSRRKIMIRKRMKSTIKIEIRMP
jgi:hypothetical protein